MSLDTGLGAYDKDQADNQSINTQRLDHRQTDHHGDRDLS